MSSLQEMRVPSPEHVARDVLESLHEGCQVVSPDFRYVYVNPAVARHAKRTVDELLGRTMQECFPGIETTRMFEVLSACLRERRHDRMLNEFTYPDGSRGWFELRFVPVPEGLCVLSLDITESKRAELALARSEEQLRHAQKMEAVGRLAGGVAHDFNNLLSIILCYTDLMLTDLERDHPLRADLEEVHTAGKRASDLTRELLAFSRQQVMEPRVIDLNDVLRGMEKMIGRLLGADIEVTLLTAQNLGKVRADPGQLEQVVMNLVVNARDAMADGGKLTIETNDVVLDADYARVHIDVAPGPHVMIAVSDTGVGMDKDTVARIFEPFFTTKERGKGTGLGLSTAFGIVKQSGGHIWVYSEPGHGTTFKVYLPRTDADDDGALTSPVVNGGGRGTETILLVEDDNQVRAVVRGILQRSGYNVLEAQGPGEALLASEQHLGRVHLLLTDVVLPRMSGPQLAERLRDTRPDMKVLFMSGYTDEAVMKHGIVAEGAAFVQKPITPDTLTRRVREVLGVVELAR